MIGLGSISVTRRVGKGALYRQSVIALTAGTILTAPFTVHAQTDRILVTLRRPTTANPLAWTNTGIVRVSLVVTVDGVAHRFTGQTAGGIRTDRAGQERPQYVLACQPTWGYFGAQTGMPRRLGEGATTYTAHLELQRLAGSITTEVEVTHGQSQAPQVEFHSSVAFDTATDAQELSGDGVLSLSHTAGGSDRAAFAGVTLSADPPPSSTSCTYNAVGMAELWDISPAQTYFGNAGYALSAPATGAQTVTSTLSGSPDEHFLGVISMTGAHQTTASVTGTPVTTSTGAVSSVSVTVGSIGADDLVLDNMYTTSVGGASTAGADQTGRNAETAGSTEFRQSTQLGTAGGVMSWTFADPCFASTLGAVAFKPVAAGGGPVIPVFTRQYRARWAA